jgi:hypothetical protein
LKIEEVKNSGRSLFLCSSLFVLLLLSFIPLLPTPIRNNNIDDNNLIPTYAQSKADDIKDLAGYTPLDTSNKILEKEEIGDFICMTNMNGDVHCDKQLKTKDVLPVVTINDGNSRENGQQVQQQQMQEKQETMQTTKPTMMPYTVTSGSMMNRPKPDSYSNPPIEDGSGKPQNLLVRSSSNVIKETSKYELTFVTQARGTIAAIEIKFPPGFQLGNVNLLERSGIESLLSFSNSAASLANGIIRLEVDPAQTIGAGNIIKLDFGNIINSHVPENNYQVTITTKDTKNNIIDGPVVSAPFGIRENTYAEITTEDSTSANKDNSINESTTAEESDDKIIVGELNEDDGVTKDLILGAPSVDKDSVRNIVEAVIPCKPGEIAVVGGYEVISNTNERPEKNAVKVFVKCLTL